jgi:hypothetical protein
MNALLATDRLMQFSPQLESIEERLSTRDPKDDVARQFKPDAGAFNEGVVMEFAAELLEARSETAFGATLARLIDRAAQAATAPVDRAVAQELRRRLQRISLDALPFAGRALGTRHRPESVAAAARLLGLELEGLSPEDKEFELTKSFVRFAADAVRHAAVAADEVAPPPVLAAGAIAKAARHWAPGLLNHGVVARPGAAPAPSPVNPDLTVERPQGVRAFSAITHRKESTMHDIDRTQPEYSNESFEFGENEWSPETGGTFNENEEMELATELLSVSNEAELDRFLGDLVSKATRAVGSFIRSPAGQAVGGVLKGVAKKALPMAGTAIGGYFGGPLGAKIGAGIANAASNALGLEAEMEAEDREFEGAKQFVRIAGQTAAKVAAAPPGSDPRAMAQQAAMVAAMQHAPGLLAGGAAAAASAAGPAHPGGGARSSGRWVRRGNKIVLYGV